MATAPMNILVVTGIFPPDIGGPATYVPNLSGELVKRGHKITVVTLSDSLGHDDRSYAYSVHRIRRSLAKPLRLMFTVLRILHAGRRAQVLYVNGLYLEAVVANFVLRKPLVQKIVGDWAWERATNKGWVLDSFEEFQTRRYGLKVEFVKALRSFCARRANTVIVPSRFLARVVSHWRVSEKKTAVIYNAVEECSSLLKAEGEDLSSFAGLRPFHTSLSTRIKVVTVGRLVPWKRIDRLIEALCECDEAGLVIVGDGPERGRLEALARQRQVDDRVYFAGERTKQETVALMAACDHCHSSWRNARVSARRGKWFADRA
jgi:glycosyltransferase involved in cell wall biosynthesis